MRKSTKIPRILKIHRIDGFKITCVFNSGEYKTIDFEKILEDVQEGDPEYPLKDLNTFKQVEVNKNLTLSWPNVTIEFESFDFPGEIDKHPLDLDPFVLYEAGEPYRTNELHIGYLIKEERQKFNLSQEELAKKSGTTKAYISRLENGKSDIEVGTLRKIVEIGLGEELHISIRKPNSKVNYNL